MEDTHEAPGSSRNFEQGYNISLCAPPSLLQNVSLIFVCSFRCTIFGLIVPFTNLITNVNLNLIHHTREELRKWFLSMETTLFRYRFRLETSESQVISYLFVTQVYTSML